MRGEFLDLGGVRLYYYAAGSRGAGEPIVLLHGFPTSGHLWSGVVPLLPTGHRVVVVDLLGYGRSDPPRDQDVSIRGHARRVVSLLDNLGIDVACIVGHDIGGGIAQSVAVEHPQRVSRLCLASSVAFADWPSREVRMARAMLPLTRHLPLSWMLSVMRGDLLRGYVDHERGSHEIERYLRTFADTEGHTAFVAHLEALQSRDTIALAGHLAELRVPTAILWGERDPFLPSTIGARLQAAISGATLQVIPDGRHFIPVESSHRVAAAITDLMTR
jgi:pimeloyl-ACP methyl ester carboxylesterase